ncbi:TPM domain-containing protein [Butyrivibrio sp. AE2032]|uniref:TPM domain-containing protein n=1 Tax=Butyrivibrio sp. AE2032 TaxID=1458463 RepID=UPI0005560212|nr:TPM domain-containing protein [Butyrivibrio sp. AE2032]
MSENLEINEMNQNKDNGPKLSVLSELNGASISVGIGLLVIIILSVAFYIFMNLSPAKTVKVVDDAELFTSEEIDDIKDAAKKLSKDKDISVVIVTTNNKGKKYTNSDEDEKRFAEDFYMENVKTVPLQNNSGVCILIDVTLDYQGGRFFWLYTYGTAHFAVSDDECYSLFRKYLSELGSGEYGTAVEGITKDLGQYSYQSYGAIVFFTVIIPIGLSLIVTGIASPKRRLDKLPAISTYSVAGSNKVDKSDKFIKKKVIHHESSSSGGGGFSGGGGGGFSGGGGGGFSGGGGGRF